VAESKFISLPWRTRQMLTDGLEKIKVSASLDNPELADAIFETISAIDVSNDRGLQKLNSLCERYNIDPSMSEIEKWAAVGWVLAKQSPEYKPPTKIGRPVKRNSIDVERSLTIEVIREWVVDNIPALSDSSDRVLVQLLRHMASQPGVDIHYPDLSRLFSNTTTLNSIVKSLSQGNVIRKKGK